MKRRDIIGGIAGAAIFPGAAFAQTDAFQISLDSRQGNVLRGRAPVGSTVQIGGLVAPFDVDSDGQFAAGLSRNAPASVIAVCRPKDGPLLQKSITVAQRHYLSVTISGTARSGADTESSAAPNSDFGMYRGEELFEGGDVNTPQDESERATVAASNEGERLSHQQRLNREVAAKYAAFASLSPIRGYQEQFRWPVRGRVTSQWGAQRTIVTRGGETRPQTPHGGVDIRAVTGTPVLAPASAKVVLADPDYFYDGGVVFLDHGQGLISVYLHMSAVSCTVGQQVAQGFEIGQVGSKGRATGPHLCWRMKWRGLVDVDPTSLVPQT